MPYFEGERTPNLPDATASLTGMTLASTTRENLARAAVEGMLGGTRRRPRGAPRAWACRSSARCSSAAARSPRRCGSIAPLVLGVPVEVPAPGEYVALGAARQAARVAAA